MTQIVTAMKLFGIWLCLFLATLAVIGALWFLYGTYTDIRAARRKRARKKAVEDATGREI